MDCPTMSSFVASGSDRDDELRTDVAQALASRGYHALRVLRVSVEDGCVCLHGCVSSYFLKQVAQSAAMSVPGVSRLFNHIEIR